MEPIETESISSTQDYFKKLMHIYDTETLAYINPIGSLSIVRGHDSAKEIMSNWTTESRKYAPGYATALEEQFFIKYDPTTESKKYYNDHMKNIGTAVTLDFDTGNRSDSGTRKRLKAKLVVEFKTKIKDNYDLTKKENRTTEMVQMVKDGLISGVGAVYKSYDGNNTFIRSSFINRNLYNQDTDGDGLKDGYEKYLFGTDYKNIDTDGDERIDGNSRINGKMGEVINPDPILVDGVYKIEGTDPNIVPPIPLGSGILAKKGEIIRGKTQPHKTMAIRLYDKSTGRLISWTSLGDTISDSEGNYVLRIGKVFKNGTVLNKYGNTIEFDDQSNLKTVKLVDMRIDDALVNAHYNEATQKFGDDNTVLKIEEWSDGFDDKPKFSKPEVSEPLKKVNSANEKYNKLNPSTTIVINDNDLTAEEKERVKERVYNNINDGSHQDLLYNLRNGKDSIIVSTTGEVTIQTQDEGSGFDI